MRIQERQDCSRRLYARSSANKNGSSVLDVPVFRQPERLYEGQTIKLDQLKQRLYQATANLSCERKTNDRIKPPIGTSGSALSS